MDHGDAGQSRHCQEFDVDESTPEVELCGLHCEGIGVQVLILIRLLALHLCLIKLNLNWSVNLLDLQDLVLQIDSRRIVAYLLRYQRLKLWQVGIVDGFDDTVIQFGRPVAFPRGEDELVLGHADAFDVVEWNADHVLHISR